MADLNSRLIGLQSLYAELGMADRIEFCNWLWKSHQEEVEYSYMQPSERKIWAHFYPNVSKELGMDTNSLSGGRKIEEK